jgi:RNA polymerase sigma-70 factor, ECF subfamily
VAVDELRQLVDRARTRDADAWEMLYRRVYPRLFAYARRRLMSDHAADDAVSETMSRALDGVGGFAWRGGGFDAWLYGIMRNVIYEASRARAKVAVGHGEFDLPTDADEPLARVIAREEAVAVRAAFERLTADEQELLELQVVGGLSAGEVGTVVGKRAGAVRMAQARALERLRSLLARGASQRRTSSASRNARSSDWRALRRGSHSVS